MSEENQMRRQPKQARSKQRVDHLLNVAAQTFEEVGYAAATTNAVAARAGISIASLYQFFPNKEAIMAALVERYLKELQEVAFTMGENLPITTRLEQALDRLEDFHQTHTGFRALFLGTEIENHIQDVLIEFLDAVLAEHFPTLNAGLRRQTASACLGITKGIMQLSEQPGHLPESAARAEVKLALFSYLRTVLLRAGVPLPADLQEL
jgi:AcrR family transcriptional regulator